MIPILLDTKYIIPGQTSCLYLWSCFCNLNLRRVMSKTELLILSYLFVLHNLLGLLCCIRENTFLWLSGGVSIALTFIPVIAIFIP
ncbi:hypothetical protein BDZ97DRAFT_1899838 [Flammula alnicola]|nr:hypothetical protein BDZ97DRAFT_1899838 [Flammula alnicola]